MLLIIAIVGTTVAPWQLFFQQSNVIDKRITPRWINYERADTVIGAFVVVLGAAALIAVTAFAFGGTPAHGDYTNAGTVASELRRLRQPDGGRHLRHRPAQRLADRGRRGDPRHLLCLRRRLRRQPFAASRLSRGQALLRDLLGSGRLAAAIVLIPGAPLGVMTEAVQALAGIVLPSATVFLLLLCNDREVLGPWVNGPWVNALASRDRHRPCHALDDPRRDDPVPGDQRGQSDALPGRRPGAGSAGIRGAFALRRRKRRGPPPMRPQRRRGVTGRCPRLALLERPRWSSGRKAAMMALRGYLVVAVLLLIVKATQLGGA